MKITGKNGTQNGTKSARLAKIARPRGGVPIQTSIRAGLKTQGKVVGG